MTNKIKTRNALFTSIISLLLCVSMLVGTTFAWFTDEVVSGTNVITAGNLDVELYHSDKAAPNGEKVTGNTVLFDDVTLWEPGAVAYENFVVANEGNLALKYQLDLNFDNATENEKGGTLADVLKVAVVKGGFTGDRKAAQALNYEYDLSTFTLGGELKGDTKSETYGVVVYWQPTDNDNDYNMNNEHTEVLTIDLGIHLFATQLEAESDSFGPDYDDNIWADAMVVVSEDDLLSAIAAGETEIKLEADIALTKALEIPAGAKIALNLNGKTLSSDVGTDEEGNRVHVLKNLGSLTLVGGTVSSNGTNGGSAVYNEGTATIEGTKFNGAPFGSTGNPSYVFNNNGGTMTISNAEIEAQHGVFCAYNNGVTTVNNTTATMGLNGKTHHVFYTYSGGAITVNGGTYTNKATDQNATGGSCINGAVTTNAGTFNGRLENYYGNPVLQGGTFSVNPKASFIAAGYKAVETSSGWMVISADNDYVADGVLKSADEKTFYLSSKEGFEWMESQSDSYFAGKTVTLEESIDFGGETIDAVRFWEPENKTTFDGNGMTISNFVLENTDGNAGLFNGTLTVKNLNIVGAEVTGKYAGVIAGNMYGDIINCTVKDSVINGTYWQTGALVGQYNGGNIIDCVVENCEINGLAAVGGLVGILNESAGERKIENCTVKDCEINQTGSFGGDYDKMFGVVTGCVNIENSTVTISGVYEDNTVKGAASDALCGVVADSTKVYVLTTADNGMKLKEDVATGAMSLSSVADLSEEDVTIPAEVSALGNAVFAGNANITSVTIPATVTDFGASGVSETNASGGAFKGSNVKTVTLSEGMTEIPAAAFNGATKLTAVNIPASVEKIGVNAFRSTALTELTIPATVKEIAYGAFRDMTSLEKVTIEGNAVTLPGYVFRGCTNLREVYLNVDTLTLNGSMNFANASSNNPGTNNIKFYCKNTDVADAVKAHMGVGSYVAIYVNGSLYAEIN